MNFTPTKQIIPISTPFMAHATIALASLFVSLSICEFVSYTSARDTIKMRDLPQLESFTFLGTKAFGFVFNAGAICDNRYSLLIISVHCSFCCNVNALREMSERVVSWN